MSIYPLVCQFCGKPAGMGADADNPMCLDCVSSRAKAAMDGRCHCPKSLRRESDVHTHFSRKWTTCGRCLGTVRQLA
jgi:hypothetical protein